MNYRVKGIQCTDEKIVRFLQQTQAIEDRKALFPESAHWLAPDHHRGGAGCESLPD